MDFTSMTTASTPVKLAVQHGFDNANRLRLDQVITQHADQLRTAPQGSRDFATHMDLIFVHFRSEWKRGNNYEKWTKSSIRRILSNRVFALNAAKGVTTRPYSNNSSKASSKPTTTARNPSPFKNPVRNTRAPKIPLKQNTTADKMSMSNLPSKTPEPDVPFIKAESPLDSHDQPAASSRKRKRTSQTPSTASGNTMDGDGDSLDLKEIILVIKASPSDPWHRRFVSFPLWRCLPQINGKDSPSHKLEDWSDLSFIDFLRQLRTEGAITDGEVIQWGDYSQLVTSNLTFASAVQEQVQQARVLGESCQEVTFTVAKRN